MNKKLFFILTVMMLSGCSGSTPKVEYCEGIQCDMRDQRSGVYKPWEQKKSRHDSSEIKKGVSISGDW